MKHLTDPQLNGYLDNVLAAPEREHVEVHLAECADCRAEMDSLLGVFRALASLPEETPRRDLTPSVLKILPRNPSGLIWRLAFAVQAGMSLGVLLLLAPSVTERFARAVQGMSEQIVRSKLELPVPLPIHFSLPAIRLPHPPEFKLPLAIMPSNLPIWLILGIAAVLLFVVGNFSLIFNSSSESKK